MKVWKSRLRSIIISGIILALGLTVLHFYGFILIPDDAPVEVTIISAFWWLILFIIVYNWSKLISNKNRLLKILGLIFLLFLALIVDERYKVPDNPLVILSLVAFWLGLLSLLFPRFYDKYQSFIFLAYGSILTFFLIVRLGGNYPYYREGIMTALLFPVPIMIVLWFYNQWQNYQELKSSKTAAELALLKSQVNPHFFFNTLNNLYSLTVSKPEEAPPVILKLSEMMRYSIYEGKKNEVRVAEEVTYLENYLALHKIRHNRPVDIRFHHAADPEFKLAPLLFIILVENAFKHGVEQLEEDAFVHINLETKKKQLFFRISNNYESAEAAAEYGIGLKNLQQRLELTYSDRYTLDINDNGSIFTVEMTLNGWPTLI